MWPGYTTKQLTTNEELDAVFEKCIEMEIVGGGFSTDRIDLEFAEEQIPIESPRPADIYLAITPRPKGFNIEMISKEEEETG